MRERWSVEGSYEMNPTWERQIDSGRVLWPRVFFVAALLAASLSVVRLLAWPGGNPLAPAAFGFTVGLMALIQVPILMATPRPAVAALTSS